MKPIRLLFAATLLLLGLTACDKEDRHLPVLEFETTELSIDAAGDILTVGILTDVAYEVVMPADAPWLKYAEGAQTKAQPTAATLLLEVEKNTTPAPRTAEVIVRATDLPLADTLHISQSGISANTDITAEFDPDFANCLQDKGIIADAGRITYADVAGITELDVRGNYSDWKEGKGLTSLKGIEYFTSLAGLDCRINQLTALDVSKNTALTELDCDNNQLTALDLSRNTALKVLYCGRNQLTDLDLSRNTALTELYCYSNQLTVLDVSRNTALTKLSCVDNRLTVLDLSRNTTLVWLFCNNNQLATLDLSRNTALTLLHCENNPGKEGFFEITRWPGSELKAGMESWEYDGKPVAVKYLGNGE